MERHHPQGRLPDERGVAMAQETKHTPTPLRLNKTGNLLAYVWASGLLGFTSEALPDGALPIARGTGSEWREKIEVLCRLARDGSGQYFVPGIPEAENQSEAFEALKKFKGWLKDCDNRAKARGEA